LSRIFIDRFDSGSLRKKLAEALEWTDAKRIIRPATRVFIKPNLTWRIPTPGVTVTPAFIRAVVEVLRPLTSHIVIGESEGGQACFRAEDAFEAHGVYDLARDHGIKVVNLSKCPHESASVTIGGRRIVVDLASILLHEVDVFITLPVPKIHALTGVSLGFKNQWGCLGDKMRVTQHPRFASTVLGINRILNPRLCIFDGTYFLDRTGPMMGQPVQMNLLVMGDDVGAATRACCEIMRIDPSTITHLRLAQKEGMFPASLDGVVLNRPPGEFADRQFRLRRAPINYVHLAAFRTRALNRLFYDSAFADGLHEALWAIRRLSVVKRFLYGKYGPGDANRGGRPV
jgi:uncharacterized protein (DUF362 family)